MARAYPVFAIFVIVACIAGLTALLTGVRLTGNKVADLATTGVRGTVTIGPTCPVEQTPPDPNCADKPYAADLIIVSSDAKIVARATPDEKGMFSTNIPGGEYTIAPFEQGMVFPHAGTQKFTVIPGQFTEIHIQ